MAKRMSAKAKRNQLLAALQTAEKQVKGLRETLGLLSRAWPVDPQLTED